MKITRFLRVAAVALVATAAIPLQSQADTTLRWNGTDPATLLKNSATETFYLYNVGTGKFIKADGEWGIQGVFMFQNFGTGVYMQQAVRATGSSTTENIGGAYIINTNIKTETASPRAQYLGVNYAEYSNGGAGWNESSATYGLIFDSQSYSMSNGYYNRSLVFEEVSGYASTQKAYYIKETIRKTYSSSDDYENKADSVCCYWGAKFGKDQHNTWTDDNGDVATFMTVQKGETVYEDSLALVKGDNKDYYTWILVGETELSEAHVQDVEYGGGLISNMSYLLHDQYFDRNRASFSTSWTTKDYSGTDAGNYRYNWLGAAGTTVTPWSTPLFQKITVDKKEYGKYSFASFEGIGATATHFTAPATGYYDLEIRGFCQSDSVYDSESDTYKFNDAYFFAVAPDIDTVGVALPRVAAGTFTKCSKSATNADALLAAPGKALYDNENGKYTVKIQVYAEEGKTVYLGIYKHKATQSSRQEGDYWFRSYYYDTDYVGVDNMQVYYAGNKPFVLDEDATSDQYMRDADFGTDGKDAVVYLKRSFTLNKWNTFVLPLDLTAAQIKEAFGEDTKLAGLKGIRPSDDINCIDFETISLDDEGTALEKGQMYLIKPVNDGVKTTVVVVDADKYTVYNDQKMYTLGRRALDGDALVDPVATENGVKFTGTYVALGTDKGPQAKSYVFNGGDMYHLQNAKKIKGFRGWFENIDPKVQSIKFNIGSGEITGIDEVTTGDSKDKSNGAVFTIDGVKVRDNAISLDGLPAGIYIYNGKKHLVK